MNKLLRSISALLISIFLLTMFPITSSAAPQQDIPQVTETYINPIYRNTVTESDLNTASESAVPFSDTEEYHTSVSSASKAMREQMAARQSTITLNYKVTGTIPDNLLKDIADQAMVHTGKPTEGDYLRWQYAGWRGSYSGYTVSGTSYLVLTYTLTYYTTAEQEKAVDSKVAAVLSELGISGQRDYIKLQKIYDYICNHTVYDYGHLNDSSYKLKHTAYAALIDGTAVCQGYAVLFYRMALQSGVDARLISGTGNGGAHAWNIAKLAGSYYNLDATWDASYAQVGWDYRYFLKCDSNFSDHIRDSEYKTSSFYSAYPMGKTDYKDDGSDTSPPTAVTGLKIGGRVADALRLNWTKNTTASGYIIEQYKGGKWTRIARIADRNTTTFRVENLSASTTYQFRIQAFAFDGSTPLYSSYTMISGKTNPSVMRGVVIGGRAPDALRINWTKNTTASGYIIEQYKNGKWTRIARIADKNSTTYRVENLSLSTSYQFRIQAFGFDGSTPLYGSYMSISGKTLPAAVANLRIGGRAKDALRLNWDKNANADGYIIEQKKDGKWVRIARIGNNSTITYRVEGLKSATQYNFRVNAFDFDGSTPIYSPYKYVDGKTY